MRAYAALIDAREGGAAVPDCTFWGLYDVGYVHRGCGAGSLLGVRVMYQVYECLVRTRGTRNWIDRIKISGIT